MNKEVNRHIHAYTSDRATTENFQEILPFVQRTLNSTINDRIKISRAQHLYGNAINMDEGILIPRGEVYLIPENIKISLTNMIKIQSDLIRIAARLLKESDDEHNPDVTQFEVGSYVLVTQCTQPETRMYTMWRGLLRVLSNKKGEYTLLYLITLKNVKYHMSQLNISLFNPLHTNPTDVAR